MARGRTRKRAQTTGKLSITAKGFGFVQMEEPPDIFIDFEHLGTAMDGDEVEVEIFQRGPEHRPAGRIVRIVERSGRLFVGIFRRTETGGKVHPEDSRIPTSFLVSAQSLREDGIDRTIRTGQVVMARLLKWEDRNEKPVARIEEILGNQDEPGMDLKIIALSRGLSLRFPEEAEREAAGIRSAVSREELRRREDLRRVDCFTIDPPSARDFDDALSIRQLPDGLFEVGVHIADVSAFVTEGSALDREARNRGTSVYFVGSALPMLPERISSDLCSLRPGEDRLAYTVFAVLDSLGNVHSYRFTESVIRSKHRFTYREVDDILHGGEHAFASRLHLLQLLAHVLRTRRQEEGSVDFDTPGRVIILDEEGIPRAIRPAEQRESNRLVAEFMLMANRLVAGHAESLAEKSGERFPFLYRVHGKPDQEDVESLVSVLHDLGIPYKVGEPVTSEDYRNILAIIQNLEFRDFVERIAFRSMTKADYVVDNKGHFGLAFPAYTHFTSPIRRYADLTVHRLLKRYTASESARRGKERKPERNRPVRKGAGASDPGQDSGAIASIADRLLAAKGRQRTELVDTLRSEIDAIGRQCSQAERTANAAEREYTKLKSLEYLSRKVGNVYDGVISGVASFGIFVELSRYLTDGLVRLSDMKDDFYRFDEKSYSFVGEKTGKVYRLGDRVSVKIQRVSVMDRKADFVFM